MTEVLVALSFVGLLVVTVVCLWELRSSRTSALYEREAMLDRFTSERAQLLNRIQEPTAAVLQSMAQMDDEPRGQRPNLRGLESREPSINQQQRESVAANIDAELEKRGIEP